MGIFRITTGGQTREYRNLITNSGKLDLLKTIAGQKNGWLNSIMVGINATAATVNDKNLGFAVSGAESNMSIVDPINEKIYFKASLPVEDDYTIYELGCHAGNFTTAQRSTETGGSLLTVFVTSSPWVDSIGTSTSDVVNNRIGIDSISYSILASATAKGGINFVNDFSALPQETKFSLAYYCSNLADLILRFKNDSGNYFQVNTLSVTNGYNISGALKSDFTLVGSPTWSSIKFLEIEAIATGSPGSISLDALRYDITGNSNDGLLSHVIITPERKLAGVTMDVEYVFDFDI